MKARASAISAALPPVQRIGSDPPLPPEALKSLLGQVKSAMAAHDYPAAIRILTQLQRQPEFPDRARAQELLGLAREGSGQLAHAKAEYEEYLRRYPKGEAGERVALRLRILRAATETAQGGSQLGRSERRWQLLGTVQLPYRWNVSFDAERRNSPVLTTRNALIGQPATSLTQLESQGFTQETLFQRARDRTPAHGGWAPASPLTAGCSRATAARR